MDKDKEFFDTGKHKKFNDDWYFNLMKDIMDLATLAKYNQGAKDMLFNIQIMSKIEMKIIEKGE